MTSSVVHFELPADDVERAKKFYEQAFGWTMRSMPGMGHTLVGTTATDEQGMPVAAGAINGGMLARQAPITAPVITIKVDDIAAAVRDIETNGGVIVRSAMAVGGAGFAAYFRDPEGNVLGLWQDGAR